MPAPTPEEIDQLAAFGQKLAHAAAVEILPRFRQPSTVENKLSHGFDPVTEADKAAEQVMRDMIERHYPDHGIYGEEFGEKPGKSGFTWVLDPIDGTRSFIFGMPSWTTLIGLKYENKAVAGVINQPYVGESFIGSPRGAFNIRAGVETKLHVRPTASLANALVGTTSQHLYQSQQQLAVLNGVRAKARSLRYDGDAYFFCLLASGQVQVAMDAEMQPYDIVAVIPLIEAAGGVVHTFDGGSPAHGGNVIAAASEELYQEVAALSSGL